MRSALLCYFLRLFLLVVLFSKILVLCLLLFRVYLLYIADSIKLVSVSFAVVVFARFMIKPILIYVASRIVSKREGYK